MSGTPSQATAATSATTATVVISRPRTLPPGHGGTSGFDRGTGCPAASHVGGPPSERDRASTDVPGAHERRLDRRVGASGTAGLGPRRGGARGFLTGARPRPTSRFCTTSPSSTPARPQAPSTPRGMRRARQNPGTRRQVRSSPRIGTPAETRANGREERCLFSVIRRSTCGTDQVWLPSGRRAKAGQPRLEVLLRVRRLARAAVGRSPPGHPRRSGSRRHCGRKAHR